MTEKKTRSSPRKFLLEKWTHWASQALVSWVGAGAWRWPGEAQRIGGDPQPSPSPGRAEHVCGRQSDRLRQRSADAALTGARQAQGMG